MYNQGPERRPDQPSQLPSFRYPNANAYPIGHHPTTSASTSYIPNFVNSYGSNKYQLQAPVLGNSTYQTLGHNRIPLGPHRCTRAGCSYSAHSKKDIENHMMDRHFIFPPGWNERKGPKADGDVASLVLYSYTLFSHPRAYSLKFSCMFMQMFPKKLDTPEAIAEWIAERKKRWPSLRRKEEKVRLLSVFAFGIFDLRKYVY